MEMSVICKTSLHVALPVIIVGSSAVRVTAFSVAYLLYLLIYWQLPSLRSNPSVGRWLGLLLKVLIAVSSIASIGHVVTQIFLAAKKPYGSGFGDEEVTWHQIGFSRLNIAAANVVRLILPDYLVLVVSIICHRLLSKTLRQQAAEATALDDLSNQNNNPVAAPSLSIWELWYSGAPLTLSLWVAAVCFPSVPTLVYLFIFLTFMLAWSLGLGSGGYHITRKMCLQLVGIHIVSFYLYQFPFFHTNAESYMNLLGLVALIDINTSDYDLRYLDLQWPAFTYPLCLLWLYFVASIPARRGCTQGPTASSSRLKRILQRYSAIDIEGDDLTMPFLSSEVSPPSAASGTLSTVIKQLILALCNYNFLATLVAMMVWAIAFPSWTGFVLLLWACIFWIQGRQRFLRTTPLLVCYASLVIMLEFYYHLPNSPLEDKDLEQLDLTQTTLSDITLYLGLKITCLYFFCLSCYYRDGVSSTVAFRNASSSDNKSRENATVWTTAWKYVGIVWDIMVEYAYMLSLVLVYVASLFDVTLLNALYLCILFVFWSFPTIREQAWVLLVVYCEAVILLVYLFGFPLGSVLSSSDDWIGLDKTSHSRLWYALRWHLAILFFSLVQFLAYQYTRSTQHSKLPPSERTPLLQRKAEQNRGHTSLEESSEGPTPKRGQALLNLFSILLLQSWMIIAPLCLLLCGLLGSVTGFKLGYLVFLFLFILMRYFKLPSLSHKIWIFVILYAGFVLIIKYVYQFETVRDKWFGGWSDNVVKDIGFKTVTTQWELFKYVVAPTMVLFVAVVQVRVVRRVALKDNPMQEFSNDPVMRRLLQFERFCVRAIILFADKVAVFVMLAAALWPDVSPVDVVEVLFAGLLMIFPSTQSVVRFLSFLWLEIIVLAKLFFQLQSLHPDVAEDKDTTWAGFIRLNNENFSSGEYVHYYIVALTLLFLQSLARQHASKLGLDLGRISLFDNILQGENASFLDAVLFKLNHFIDLYGLELCYFVTLIAAFIRLNFMSVYYFLWLAMMIKMSRKKLGTIWRTFLLVTLVLLVAQYSSFVGMPPGYSYPYDSFLADNYYARALFRWCVIPPDENVISRGPEIWNHNTGLLADFTVLFICSLQMTVFHSPSPKLDDARVTKALKTVTKAIVAFYPWATLLIMYFAVLERIDVFCIGYMGFGSYFMFNYQKLYVDPKRAGDIWAKLLWYTYAVLAIRLVWILPAVAITWTSQSSALFSALQLFGMRNGVDVQLLPTDRRISPWDPDGGILFELLLFIFAAGQRHVLNTPEMTEIAATRGEEIANAEERSKDLARILLYKVEKRQQTQDLRAQRTHEIVEKLDELRSKHELVRTEGTARWFSTKNLKEVTDLVVPEGEVELIEQQVLKDDEESSGQTLVDIESDANVDGSEEELENEVEQDEDEVTAADISFDDDSVAKDSTEADKSKDTIPGKIKAALIIAGIWLGKQMDAMIDFINSRTIIYRHLFGERTSLFDTVPDLVPKGKEEPITITTEPVQGGRMSRLCQAIMTLLYAKTNELCFLLMIVNPLTNADLLSIMFPLLLFLWGALARPSPSYRFWLFMLGYAHAVLFLKYIFQFGFWGSFNAQPADDDRCASAYLQEGCVNFVRMLGIVRVNDGFSFVYQLIPDILLVISLFVHRAALRRLGRWGYDSTKSYEVFDKAQQLERGGHSAESESIDQNRDNPEDLPRKGVWYRIRRFYWHILYDKKGLEPADYYTWTFLVEFLSLFVIIFGWSGFKPREEAGNNVAADILKQNNVPSGLLGLMLAQFFLIILERIVYLNRAIKFKLVFHYILVLLIHIVVFYWIPLETKRPFRQNAVIIILYLLKVCYFSLSAAQIRHNYPNSVLANFLTKSPKTPRKLLYPIYKAIPFLYELRALIDWTTTTTTLSFDDWFKMEDIHGQLFSNQCRLVSLEEDGRPFGKKQPMKTKCLTGFTLVSLLVFVIWLPLLVMSLIHQASEPNLPSLATVSLSANSFEPLFVMDNIPHGGISEEDYRTLLSMDNSGFVKSFAQSDIERFLLSPVSKDIWIISPASQAMLADALQRGEDVTLKFDWSFKRKATTTVIEDSIGSNSVALAGNSTEAMDFLNALESNNIANIIDLFPTFYHLDETGLTAAQQTLPPALTDVYVDCNLKRFNDSSQREWWALSQSSPHVLSSTDNKPSYDPIYPRTVWLELITFNNRVAPETLQFLNSYGIVGLYISVVLVVGKFLRLFVDKMSQRIIYENMDQVQTLQNLCQAIYMAREREELRVEEELFNLLISLYRSPESLIVWTSPKLKQE